MHITSHLPKRPGTRTHIQGSHSTLWLVWTGRLTLRLRATRGLRGPARFQGCRLEHLTPAAPPADTVLSEAGAHGGVLGPVLRRPRQEEPGPCGRSCCDSSHPLPSRAAVAASKSPLFISTPFSQDHGCTSPKRVVRVAARVRRPPSRGHAQARTRASPGHPCFSSV